MTTGFGEWGWVLLFFPLWFVMAPVWFAAVIPLKRQARPRTVKILEGSAALLSICCAAGMLMTLDCSSAIHISFLDPVCHAPLFQPGNRQVDALKAETLSQIASLL